MEGQIKVIAASQCTLGELISGLKDLEERVEQFEKSTPLSARSGIDFKLPIYSHRLSLKRKIGHASVQY